jgi:hypothetical protein
LLDKLTAVSPAVGDKIPLTDISGGIVGYSTIADILGLSASAKIATGSYIGTGTVGSANPNSLTFAFAPAFIIIWSEQYYNSQRDQIYACAPAIIPFASMTTNVLSYNAVNSSGDIVYQYAAQIAITASGNTLSWYNTFNSTNQWNASGVRYYWAAIG